MLIKCIVFLGQGLCGELASFCCEKCTFFFCAFHSMTQDLQCKACKKPLKQMTVKVEAKMQRKLKKLRKEYEKKHPKVIDNKPAPELITNLPPIGKKGKSKGRVKLR